MPHVVQADALDPGPVDEPVKAVGDRVGVHRAAVRVADEQPRIVVIVSERFPFGGQREPTTKPTRRQAAAASDTSMTPRLPYSVTTTRALITPPAGDLGLHRKTPRRLRDPDFECPHYVARDTREGSSLAWVALPTVITC